MRVSNATAASGKTKDVKRQRTCIIENVLSGSMRKAALKMQDIKTKSFDVSSFLPNAQSRPRTLQLIIFKRKACYM